MLSPVAVLGYVARSSMALWLVMHEIRPGWPGKIRSFVKVKEPSKLSRHTSLGEHGLLGKHTAHISRL